MRRFKNIWSMMIRRCEDINYTGYEYYGGRGITVCERWHNFDSFVVDMFAKYVEHKEKFGDDNTTLERMDNEKGYEPSNCRWATQAEQATNKRRPTKKNAKVESNGLRLRNIRKRAGMTQFELANATGYTQGYISRLEMGDGVPTVVALVTLADALGVPAGELIGG